MIAANQVHLLALWSSCQATCDTLDPIGNSIHKTDTFDLNMEMSDDRISSSASDHTCSLDDESSFSIQQ